MPLTATTVKSLSSDSLEKEAIDPKAFLETHWLKLIPFGLSIMVYFLAFIPEDEPSMFAMGLKCLPILCLALFVFLLGLDESFIRQRIFAGLLFSAAGDACLIWEQKLFMCGVVAFGFAQINYIRAHGLLGPLRWKVLAVILIFALPGLTLITPRVMTQDTGLIAAISVYSPLLITMFWRATVRTIRAQENKLDCLVWTFQCAFFGGLLFFISDSVLSINKFYTPIPYHQLIVMSTYYGSQLMTALSSYRPFSVAINSKSKFN